MWGSTMPQYQVNDAFMHPNVPMADAQSSSYMWNGYSEPPKGNNQYMQPEMDMYGQSYGYDDNNGYSHGQEDINVSAVMSDRMRAQQILNSNSYDEEAKRKIADCDVKIKRWNESQGYHYSGNSGNYIKWGDNMRSGNGPAENDEMMNGRAPPNHVRNGPDRNEPQQYNRGHNGKKYLESWSETMREDNEMSNRQRKKEFYGMGQAWAREDFFLHLPPVRCPFGVKMLKGMGWKYGEAIGKSKEGHTVPVAVDVRYGRQGLCTKEERAKLNLGGSGRPKPPKKAHPIKNVNGKHPVSLLAEQCMKRQMELPKYDVVFEYGNIHSQSILVSVTVGGKTFEPAQPSPYKKHGKAEAAAVALKELGLDSDK